MSWFGPPTPTPQMFQELVAADPPPPKPPPEEYYSTQFFVAAQHEARPCYLCALPGLEYRVLNGQRWYMHQWCVSAYCVR